VELGSEWRKKSLKMKASYDQKTRQIQFREGQKVWLYNPRRIKGKAPKLQCNWKGFFSIVTKLGDVAFCIRKSSRHKKKVVHANKLAPF